MLRSSCTKRFNKRTNLLSTREFNGVVSRVRDICSDGDMPMITAIIGQQVKSLSDGSQTRIDFVGAHEMAFGADEIALPEHRLFRRSSLSLFVYIP